MIYICKGCQGACDGCCKVLNESCGCICKVLDRPLGGYVAMAWITNGICLICAALGAINPDVMNCFDAFLFCCIDIALALGHMCFAVYLQQRVVRGFENQPMTSGASQDPSAKELMDTMGKIVLYDIGFCLYVFAFFGAWAVQFVGFGWIAGCGALSTSLPYIAACFGTLYGVLALVFGFCWYCLLSCDSCLGVVGAPKPVHAGPGAPKKKQGGLIGMFIGKAPQPKQQQGGPGPVAYGTQPVQGQPVQGQPAPQQAYQPAQQAYQPGTAPPAGAAAPAQQQQSGGGQAQKAAAQGLGAAGAGLQKLGGMLGGGKSKQ